MKPKEFDDLVRQKFDQNDFAYNPAHWDTLAEKLEGKDKKRSIMMWWWVPLAGMAASVALALGVSSFLRYEISMNQSDLASAQHGKHGQQYAAQQSAPLQSASLFATPETAQNETPGANNYIASANKHNRNVAVHKQTAFNKHTNHNKKVKAGADADDDGDGFGINIKNATGRMAIWNAKPVSVKSLVNNNAEQKKKVVINDDAVNTFMPAEPEKIKKAPKLSIILSGGINHGNQNNGYMAGATIRRMINDKVYIESDVAFATSNNTQSTSYLESQTPITTATGKHMSTGKVASSEANKAAQPLASRDVIKQKDISYDLYYAQVTPSIGYKVIKRMSIAVGPDFQQMLVDNRPAPSSVDRNTVQVAPLFDVGFIGKSEYTLTKKVKAAIYYRKGVNNVITPTGKFIDRDYMQFQVKYTIFNK